MVLYDQLGQLQVCEENASHLNLLPLARDRFNTAVDSVLAFRAQAVLHDSGQDRCNLLPLHSRSASGTTYR